uniref:HTH CENPB-type domain-containing protein n=1 Tax=Strigamia maritima TaxID=126957 RepID=T1JDV7_STRMM
MAPKNRSFSAKLKLDAINFAETNSGEAAARKFQVDPKTIRDWKKRKSELQDQASTPQGSNKRRLDGAGAKLASAQLESKVVDWIYELRSNGIRVSRQMVMDEARNLFPTMSDRTTDCFVASPGWLEKFLERHHLSLRRKITNLHNDPVDVSSRLLNFFEFLNAAHSKFGFGDADIIAMDETSSWFGEKDHFTIVLSAKADGTKLKPFVVFKDLKSTKNSSSVIAVSNKNGWMDNNLTIQWLDKVFERSAPRKRLLVWDSYRWHISAATKEHLRKFNTAVAVIPSGCTKYVQALDVSWNKPFKKIMMDLHSDWRENGTKWTNGRGPSRSLLMNWVNKAWNGVSTNLIKNSFKLCGINVAKDGSEDYQIACLKQEKFQFLAKDLLQFRASEGQVQEMLEEEDLERLEMNAVAISVDDNNTH